MAVFSVNQVRHLYVAKENNEITETSTPGTIKFMPEVDGKCFYFDYMGEGGRMRSDLVKASKVKCIKHVPASKGERKLMKAVVELDDNVNGGTVIAGEDYILRIVIRQFAGMSDEDTYIKHAVVHGTASMANDVNEFYAKLAMSLYQNFSRELTPLFKFYAGTTEITPTTKLKDISGADSVTIEEVEQPWTLGVKAQEPVYFDVYPTTVTVDGDDVIWGKVDELTGKIELKESDADPIPNSKKIADLEYFCMGERGDMYRNVGWPDVIPTKYLVDPEDKKGYDVLEIHYAFDGGAENPQLSEKDIEIVGSSDVIEAIAGEITAEFPDLEVVELK